MRWRDTAVSLIITELTKTRNRLDLLVSVSTQHSTVSTQSPYYTQGPRLSEKMLRVPAAEQGPAEI